MVHAFASHFLKIHFIIILSSTPGSSKWPFNVRSSHQNPIHTSPVSHTCYLPRPSHCSWFEHPIDSYMVSSTDNKAPHYVVFSTPLSPRPSQVQMYSSASKISVNPLKPELNPICYLLALLGAHHFLHVNRIRVKSLTFRRLMSYIYMEHPFLMFLDHTQRRSTVGRTPLDEWSARRRDLYLTTHDIHNRQISMPPVGFEPTISAGERQSPKG